MTPEEARNEIDNHFRFGDAEPGRTPVAAPDDAYNFMLRSVLMNGEIVPPEEERTGTGTIKRFGLSYMVDVGARFPILTTKKVFFSSVVAEYLFFLTGATNVEELTEYTGVWDEWADEDGNLETVYGRFWRNFPRFPIGSRQVGEAAGSGPYADGGGVDQIKHVVRSIKKNPYSRRHHVTAWHPANALASKLPPCFTGDMVVATDNGTYKPIGEVVEGDRVYTGSGEIHEVSRVWESDHSGFVEEIDTHYLPKPIKCTPNHEILVKDKGWMEAKDIQSGDRIGIKRDKRSVIPVHEYTYYNDTPRETTHQHELTKEDFWTLGYFVGDGWCSTPESGNWRVCFSVNDEDKDDILPRIRKTIKVSKKPNHGVNVTTYQVRSKKWIKLFQEFGHKAHNKRIPDWVLAAPKEYVESFLRGYIAADGYLMEKKYQATTVSSHLAHGLAHLSAKLGYAVSINCQKRPNNTVIEGRTVNQRDTYSIYLFSDNCYYAEVDDNYVWIMVKKHCRNIVENESVYDLEVETDHTYTVQNAVVHNCHHSFTLYVSDGRLNIEVHQRSGDLALGVPFNMSGYALVLNLIAREVGLEPGLLKHNITDAHIYHNHLDGVVEQIKRPSKHTIGDPTLSLSDDLEGKSIFDLELSDVEHFSLEGYDHHDPIKFDVAV